jgi:hypothetical protein
MSVRLDDVERAGHAVAQRDAAGRVTVDVRFTEPRPKGPDDDHTD